MISSIFNDIRCNSESGILAIIFLINYRLGRAALLKKRGEKIFAVPIYIVCLLVARFLSIILGCSVPFSCHIGRNVRFKHSLYGVFISGNASIGDGCTIFHQVTIGSNYGSCGEVSSPIVKSNVIIGAGAKIIGGITLGNNCKIGINAVVVDDVPDNAVCVAPKAAIRVERALEIL